jgi:hypothetical protein
LVGAVFISGDFDLKKEAIDELLGADDAAEVGLALAGPGVGRTGCGGGGRGLVVEEEEVDIDDDNSLRRV